MRSKLRVLDLFSGIGGFSLGLEWTNGFETVAFCEIEKYPQEILKKHWPGVPIYEDITKLTADRLVRDGIGRIDVITGGYPCQPFSVAGKQKGEKDDRHLWPRMFKIIEQVRPTWIICENVTGHIKLGLDQVLLDLETEGYSSRTFIVPACSVNAPHRRDRIWIVAHADSDSQPDGSVNGKKYVGNSNSRAVETFWQQDVLGQPEGEGSPDGSAHGSAGESGDVAHPDSARLKQSNKKMARGSSEQSDSSGFQPRENALADSVSSKREGSCEEQILWERDLQGEPGRSSENLGAIWTTEPSVGRVADGVPGRVAKLKALGNAVVPQIPMMIGQAILDFEDAKNP